MPWLVSVQFVMMPVPPIILTSLFSVIVTSVPSPAHVAKTLWEQGRAQARRGAPARAFLQGPEVTQETWRGVSASRPRSEAVASSTQRDPRTRTQVGKRVVCVCRNKHEHKPLTKTRENIGVAWQKLPLVLPQPRPVRVLALRRRAVERQWPRPRARLRSTGGLQSRRQTPPSPRAWARGGF